MKKLSTLILGLLLLLNVSLVPARAQSLQALRSGAEEFVTAPLELGKQTAHYVNEYDHSPIVGSVAGLLEGSGAMATKLIGGFFKMLSSPFAE